MDLLKQIRDSMRIKHTELDESISLDIKAATLDMIRVGIQPYVMMENEKVLKEDELLNKAIELYCKGQADYQGNGEKYNSAYEKLRDSMSLCGDYNE